MSQTKRHALLTGQEGDWVLVLSIFNGCLVKSSLRTAWFGRNRFERPCMCPNRWPLKQKELAMYMGFYTEN